MFKLIILLICLALPLSLHSQTLNLLIVDNEQFDMFAINKAVLVNGHVIFSGKVDSEKAVWSYNVSTQQKTKLAEGFIISSIYNEAYQLINNEAYFKLLESDDSIKLWKTDGTAAGTVRLNDSSVNFNLYKNNGIIYTRSFAAGLMVTDGNTVITDTDAEVDLDSLCFFNINDYVTFQNNQLQFTLNGEQSVHAFNANNTSNSYSAYPRKIVSFQDACYAIDFENKDLWKITSTGELVMIPVNNQSTGEQVTGIFVQQDQVYLLQVNNSGIQHLRRFNADFSSIEASNSSFNWSSLAITHVKLLHDFVGLKTTTPTASPQIDAVYLLNQDLINISESDHAPFETFSPLPTAHQTSDGLLINVNKLSNGIGYINNLYFNLATDNPLKLKLPDNRINQVLSNPDSPDKLLVSTDVNGVTKLFAIEQTPDIGKIISGHWFNPNIENQGLNITQGTRANGSEYVAVTGFTYKAGLPFWFAGNTDLSAPQSSIEIDLFEFSGIGMFEADNTPDRLLYGTITLQMQSCNQLKSNLVTADEQFDMLLYRTDDVTFNQNCID